MNKRESPLSNDVLPVTIFGLIIKLLLHKFTQ